MNYVSQSDAETKQEASAETALGAFGGGHAVDHKLTRTSCNMSLPPLRQLFTPVWVHLPHAL